MSKINKLTLSNFKFFGEAQTIDVGGKHLLLYGENGSGKSTIFWGLYTLLEASNKKAADVEKYFEPRDFNEESLVNIYADNMSCMMTHKEHCNSYIEIEDDGGDVNRISLFDTTVCGNTVVKESHRATDFINYQSLFRFQQFDNNESPNLYEIFRYSVFPFVNFQSFEVRSGVEVSNAKDMWGYVNSGPERIIVDGEKLYPSEDSANYRKYKDLVNHFKDELQGLIDSININAPRILKKFGYDIEFMLSINDLGWVYCSSYEEPERDPYGDVVLDDDGEVVYQKDGMFFCDDLDIYLNITHYNGKEIDIPYPQIFLNEAKLTALALAIRFAVIEYKIGSVAPDALKVLALDDIMISLDMNNRDMLINYILKHYIDKYQILLMTHDKSLYNFIDYKIGQLSNKQLWEYKELYVGIDDAIEQESPMLVDGTCSAFDKAQLFFKANDFSTSSVYLRQSLEKLIAEALPDEIKRRADGKFMSLETLWEKLNNRHTIPQSIQDLFNQSKLMVLNPSAHYQRLSQPIYRRELLAAFDLVKQLTALNLTVDTLLIEKNKRLKFMHPTEPYTFEFELRHDMTLHKTPDPKCNIKTWTYEGIPFKTVDTGDVDSSYARCTPRFSKLKENLFNLPGLNINEQSFLDNTTIEQGSLREALNL